MTIFAWLDTQKKRLKEKKNPNQHAANIALEKKDKLYYFYGRYNNHDHYMGHPFGEDLRTFLFLLKDYNIEHELIEEKNGFEMDTSFFLQKDAYIMVDRAAYLEIKPKILMFVG